MVELNKSDSLTGEFHAWLYEYSCFYWTDNLLVFICNFVFIVCNCIYWNCLMYLTFEFYNYNGDFILYMYLLMDFHFLYKSFALIYIHKFYSPRACYI